MSQPYYDKTLRQYHIGAGQQFFLLSISQTPGISILELAQQGHFDNASATRAAQKLLSEGYITIVPDETDKRIRRMYTTEKAKPVLDEIVDMKNTWYQIVVDGLSSEERKTAERLMKRVADNAYRYNQRMKDREKD